MALKVSSKDEKGEGNCPTLTYAYLLDYCLAALAVRDVPPKLLRKIYRLLRDC